MAGKLAEGPMVVDASFVLGILYGDEAALRFTEVLSRACIVDVNLGEVFFEIDQRLQTEPNEIAHVLAAQGLEVIGIGTAGAAHFSRLKTLDQNHRVLQWAKGIPDRDIKNLSLADMACLSAAIQRKWPVLTGQSHWQDLDLGIRVHNYRDPDLHP